MIAAWIAVAVLLIVAVLVFVYQDRPRPSRRDLAFLVAVLAVVAFAWPLWAPIVVGAAAWRRFS